jgi:hypothetical protein
MPLLLLLLRGQHLQFPHLAGCERCQTRLRWLGGKLLWHLLLLLLQLLRWRLRLLIQMQV